MFNKNFKKVFLTIITIGFSPIVLGSVGILQGLKLENPSVKFSVNHYIASRGDQPKKLALGAGHINNIDDLHPDYRRNGGNSLTESLQGEDNYDFHKHEEWYTFSAETDAAFGSDMIGNIRTDSHQDLLLPPNTWDIIWDESYHPDVLSAPGLFEKILNSLKPGRSYVFCVPVEKIEGKFVPGHDAYKEAETGRFNEKMAYKNLSEKFDAQADLENWIIQGMREVGFSCVEIHKGAGTKAFERAGFEINSEISDEIEPKIIEKLDEVASEAFDADKNPLYAIDPIFAHTIGSYYVHVRK